MRSSLTLVPITAEPALRIVKQPPLDDAQQARLDVARKRMLEEGREFDGPVLIALQVSELEVQACHATYAWVRLLRDDPDALPALGLVGSVLLLHDQHGRWLWQRRGPQSALPGVWTFAAAGMVDQHETSFVGAIAREAAEELSATALSGTAPLALALEPGQGVSVLHTASVDASSSFQIAEGEVAEIRWSRDLPRADDASRCVGTEEIWRRIQPLLANREAGLS